MTQSEQEQMCPKCGQPRGGSGRLTQWIMVCSCSAIAPEEQEQEANVELCPDCGKRIEKSRPGSFTQWVFRRETCNCKNQSGSPPATRSDSRSPNSSRTASGATQEDAVPSFDQQESPEEQSRQKELYGDRIPIERYRVLRQIGEGASGTVYLCRDRMLTKDVAIKCLNHVEPEALVAFQQEARANSKLNHPNIVKVIDFGVSQSGSPYMVLEYFNGSSMEHYLKRFKKFDCVMAVEILRQICDALIYTHKQKIWHRDLKPSNVLISGENELEVEVRLIDFGVAAVRQASMSNIQNYISEENQHRTLAGTPAYMSPDQAMGKSYDARSEIYSMGCLAFEMLTGRPPFSAPTPLEVIALHSSAEPPRLMKAMGNSDEEEEVLQHLEEIIDRCLKKDPKDRFQTVEDLKQSLSITPGSEQLEPTHPILKTSTSAAGGTVSKSNVLLAAFLIAGLLGLTAFLLVRVLNTPDSPPTHSKLVTEDSEDMNDFTLKVGRHEWHVYFGLREEVLIKRIKKDRYALKNLWINAQISDKLLDEVTKLKITGFALDNAQLTTEQLARIVKMKGIVMLLLLNTPITDDQLKLITTMKHIRVLAIESDNITDEGLKCLSKLNLGGLSLGGMKQITDRSIDTILSIKNLRGLTIARSGISSDGIVRLIESKHIYSLNISGLKLNAAAYKALRNSGVRKLAMMNSDVTQETLDTISSMKQLVVVDFRDCTAVTPDVIAATNARRKKNGLPDVEILLGHDNTARDWDIMVDDREIFPAGLEEPSDNSID